MVPMFQVRSQSVGSEKRLPWRLAAIMRAACMIRYDELQAWR